MHVVSMGHGAGGRLRGEAGSPGGKTSSGKISSMHACEADTKFLRGILAALIMTALMTGVAAAYAAAQII